MRFLIGTFALILSGFAIYGQLKSEHPIKRPIILSKPVAHVVGGATVYATVTITPAPK